EKIRRYLKRTFNNVIDCRLDLAKLRAIKQPEEIRAIKQAVKLTERAFNKVKQNINNYTYEFEIEADFTHHFKSHSADHAYDPIVASGLNACTLHYHDNLAKLPKNSLVLIDIGASFGGY